MSDRSWSVFRPSSWAVVKPLIWLAFRPLSWVVLSWVTSSPKATSCAELKDCSCCPSKALTWSLLSALTLAVDNLLRAEAFREATSAVSMLPICPVVRPLS